MEGEATISAMEALFTAVSTVISKIIEIMGTVGDALLSNVIFQIMFGLLILFVVLAFPPDISFLFRASNKALATTFSGLAITSFLINKVSAPFSALSKNSVSTGPGHTAVT